MFFLIVSGHSPCPFEPRDKVPCFSTTDRADWSGAFEPCALDRRGAARAPVLRITRECAFFATCSSCPPHSRHLQQARKSLCRLTGCASLAERCRICSGPLFSRFSRSSSASRPSSLRATSKPARWATRPAAESKTMRLYAVSGPVRSSQVRSGIETRTSLLTRSRCAHPGPSGCACQRSQDGFAYCLRPSQIDTREIPCCTSCLQLLTRGERPPS